METQGYSLDVPVGVKIEDEVVESGYSGFDRNGQTINPAVTLSGLNSGTYSTYTSQRDQQSVQSTPVQTDVNFGTEPSLSSEDQNAVNAANKLIALNPAHGHQTSHEEQNHDPSTAASWGNLFNHTAFVAAYANMRNSGNSSGRQPAQPHYGQVPNPINLPGSFQQQQMWAQNWPQNQMQQGSRAPSHGNSGYFFPSALQPIPQISQGASSLRPMHPTFGSDPNFVGPGPYTAPTGWSVIEDEKATNLSGVPLAGEAAANTRTHMQNVHSGSNSQTNARNGSAAAFPNSYSHMGMGGLPIHQTPLPNYYSQLHNPYAVQSTENETINNASRHSTQPPHKPRRLSQMEREAEAAYTPHSHMRGSTSKRTVKTEHDSDYDEDDVTGTASSNRNLQATKRRKSTNNFTSPQAEVDDDEEDISDDDATPGSKRKRGNTLTNRQNLTEAEKRQNHIKSEKMRRDLIKIQYDTLDELVPALKGGKSGLSRADILNEITEYVEVVMAGNKAMEKMLRDREDQGYDEDGEGDYDEESDDDGGQASRGVAVTVAGSGGRGGASNDGGAGG
jgi:hypothetical protein